MRVLIGTYRKRAHIDTCLGSLCRHVSGVDEVVFIDDSGDGEHAAYLATWGKVIEVGRKGYTAAMTMACRAAEGRECFWLEEDFTFLTDIDLNDLSEMLYHRPWLAQLVLLRGPHFPNELEAGGVIEACEARGEKFELVSDVIEHTAFFACNPSVWRGHVFATGWPQRQWSEDAKRDELLAMGYRFGMLPGITVAHHGERTGFGY